MSVPDDIKNHVGQKEVEFWYNFVKRAKPVVYVGHSTGQETKSPRLCDPYQRPERQSTPGPTHEEAEESSWAERTRDDG